jgi:tetraacyldisaccharide 4'-kinase
MKRFFLFLLFPISIVLWTIAIIRRFAYRKGWLRSTTFNIPTICVGNLNLGGTGKTPHVEYIANFLMQYYQIAILSRGYGRKTKGYINVHEKPNHSSKILGDEPMQFATKFPNVEIAVCEKRKNGIENLLHKKPNLDVIILDDAYQHLSVNYSMRILLTDYSHPFFDDFQFPTGTLRERSKEAKYADIIIVTKCPEALTNEKKITFLQRLKPKPNQEVYFTKINYELRITNYYTNDPHSQFSTLSSKLFLITGIANPTPLVQHLETQYGKIYHLRFSDHHSFTKRDIEKIIRLKEKLGGDTCTVLTTEKDAMRLQAFENMPKYFTIPIEIVFLENETGFKEKLLSLLSQKRCVK